MCKQLGEIVNLIPSKVCRLKIMEDEMGEVCGTHGEKWIAYRVLVRKYEEQRELGKPVFSIERNSGGFKEIWWEETD